eukprot:TRINITY_DN100741_c0_g1_i1.p1 TRINITY_DN100741_c0_g1~~TRINITY_DN100741_c0_g1_i1.p1  ORF type:complete len:1138 (-),score=207.59 TRINITY_DN100741_c0_g1_i1:235-3648(-)
MAEADENVVKIFQKRDAEGRGQVNADELLAMTKDLGVDLSSAEIMSKLKDAGGENRQLLTLDEFETMVKDDGVRPAPPRKRSSGDGKSEDDVPRKVSMGRLDLMLNHVNRRLGDRVRICVLGIGQYAIGTPQAKMVRNMALQCFETLAARLKPVYITSGGRLGGVEQTFAECCGTHLSDALFHLRASREGPSGLPAGADIVLSDAEGASERLDAFAQLGHIYVVLGGGREEASIAQTAYARGAAVVPVPCLGGAPTGLFNFPAAALKNPSYVEPLSWEALADNRKELHEIAQALAYVLSECIEFQQARSAARSQAAEPVVAQEKAGYPVVQRLQSQVAKVRADEKVYCWCKLQKVSMPKATEAQKQSIQLCFAKHFGRLAGLQSHLVKVELFPETGRVDMHMPVVQNRRAAEVQTALTGESGRLAGTHVVEELENVGGFAVLRTGLMSVTTPWASTVTAHDELMAAQVSEAFVKAHEDQIESESLEHLSHFSLDVQTKLQQAWNTIDEDGSGLVDEDEVAGFFESNPSYQQTFLECGVPTPMNKAQFMKFWKELSIYLGIADILLASELDRILSNLDNSALANAEDKAFDDASHAVVQDDRFDAMVKKMEVAQDLIVRASKELKDRTMNLAKRRKDLVSKSGSVESGLHELVKLNVGGDKSFILRRGTLVHCESRLSELFDFRWKDHIPKDSDGCFFLDADPRQMRALLDWLSDAKKASDAGSYTAMAHNPHPLDRVPDTYHWGFKEMIEHYGFKDHLGSADNPLAHVRSETTQETLDSTVINRQEQFDWLLSAVKIESMLPASTEASEFSMQPWPMRPKMELAFRASRDGYSARAFHRACDGVGPTMIIAHDGEGYVFGGFCDISWHGSGRAAHAPQAFIFELCGRGVTKPISRRITKRHGGIYDHPHQGPQFGMSPELRINGSESNMTTATMRRPSVDSDYEGICTVPVSDYEVWTVTWQRSHVEEFSKMAEIVPKGLLQDALQSFLDAVVVEEQIRMALDDEEAELNSSEEEWRLGLRQSPWVASYMRSMDVHHPVIYFNVRGKKMAIMASTLELAGGSPMARRIHKQLRGETETPEVIDGAVFVDEDPDCFELIINYLRLVRMGYRMPRPPAPYGKEADVNRLADLFGMAGMM